MSEKAGEPVVKLRRITSEELAKIQKLVDDGIMISTRHPKPEEYEGLIKQQVEHGVGWGVLQMRKDMECGKL